MEFVLNEVQTQNASAELSVAGCSGCHGCGPHPTPVNV